MILHTKARVAFVALAATNTVLAANAACYDRAGNAQTVNIIGGAFTPCRADTTDTHCCAQGETCLSNGLCLVSYDSSLNTGLCADPSWKAPCLQYCDQYAFATLYRCGDSNYCCSNGGNTTSCCQDGAEPFKILQRALVENGTAFVEGYEITAIDAVRANDIETNSNSTDTAQPAATCAAGTDSSKTLAAGLGAGLGVGVPLLIAVATLAVMLHRERKKSRVVATLGMGSSGAGYSDKQSLAWSTQSRTQKGTMSELSSENPAELSGSG